MSAVFMSISLLDGRLGPGCEGFGGRFSGESWPAQFWMAKEVGRVVRRRCVVMVASSTPASRRSGISSLEDVVDGVALHAGPAQRAAVGVAPSRARWSQVPALHEAQEVVEPLLARAGPERRILQLGLVAEGVEADPAALLGDPVGAGSCSALTPSSAWPNSTRSSGRPSSLKMSIGRLRRRSARWVRIGTPVGDGGPGRRAVDALVEVGHPAAAAHPDLDDAGLGSRCRRCRR